MSSYYCIACPHTITTFPQKAVRGNRLPPFRYGSLHVNYQSSLLLVNRPIVNLAIKRPSCLHSCLLSMASIRRSLLSDLSYPRLIFNRALVFSQCYPPSDLGCPSELSNGQFSFTSHHPVSCNFQCFRPILCMQRRKEATIQRPAHENPQLLHST